VCPAGARERRFEVAAITARLPMLDGDEGRVFALRSEVGATRDGSRAAEPLVLHVNVGDCVRVALTNELPSGDVGFHVDMLAADPTSSGGVEAGRNPRQAVAPGETREYLYYADPEVGETTALVRDWGNVLEHPRSGLYGAIVVGPRGATYRDMRTGENASERASWQVEVRAPGRAPYRDFTVFWQDEDESLGTHRMPYTTRVDGVVGINYARAPLERGASLEDGPETPLIEVDAGERFTLRVVVPWSEQVQVFGLEGHAWPTEPGIEGGNVVSSQRLGGLEILTISAQAGGAEDIAGDYVYGDHRGAYREAGMWGLVRVRAKPAFVVRDAGLGVMGALALVALSLVLVRRRKPSSG
jgi:hypothetical protein